MMPAATLKRDLVGEEVATEVKVAEEGHGGDKERNFQIHSLEDRI